MAMTKAELNVIATAHELLSLSTTCVVSCKSEFAKGMAEAYKASAQNLMFRLMMKDFSEQCDNWESFGIPTKYQKEKDYGNY